LDINGEDPPIKKRLGNRLANNRRMNMLNFLETSEPQQ
jgi:hypothetical protein